MIAGLLFVAFAATVFLVEKSTASGLDKVVVNVTAVDANGQTVLHYAVAGDPDEPDDVVELLKRGAKVDARDRWAQTPLILAAFKNATRSAQVLIDQGANVNAENEDGWTALDTAANHGDAPMTKALLDKGADPNIPFRNNGEPSTKPKTETALILAAHNKGAVEVVRLLLAHGANASAQDTDGRTALSEAKRAGSVETIRELLAARPNPAA